jgi:ketosteroid isomerase-like protein
MSEQNLKLVQSVYAAFGRGDIPAVIEAMAPNATIGIVGRRQDAPFLGIFDDGKAGAAEFFKQLAEAQDFLTFEPLRFLAAEDKVFIWGRYRWTMRKSGVTKESEWLHELTLHGGKMTAWRGHNDTAMLAEAYHATPAVKAG